MGWPGHDEEFPLIPTAWPPQDVVSVILTGIPPRFPIVQARSLHHPTISTLDRLVLVIDPRTTPSDVAAIYGKLRAELAQARSGSARRIHAYPLTVKHLALARLAATRESGQVSWRELLARWNTERPEWRYGEDQLTNFIRDARAAYQRVMGEPL
jgi:hypothetical protein